MIGVCLWGAIGIARATDFISKIFPWTIFEAKTWLRKHYKYNIRQTCIFFIIFIFSVKIPLRWLRQRLAKPKKKTNPLIRRKGIRVTLRENALPNMITRRQPRFQVQGDVIFLSLPSQYHHLLLYHHSSLYSIPSKKFQIKFHKKTTMWWYVINLS